MAKFKKGDKVKVIADGSLCSFSKGEIVEIIAGPDSDGDYTARHADGREKYIKSDRVELVEDEERGFKAGDRCKIVANNCQEDPHRFEMGTVVKIVGDRVGRSYSCDKPRYRVEGAAGDAWFVLASDIELVEDEKPEFKFKVGDKCRVVTDDSCGGHGFDKGQIVEVVDVDKYDEDEIYRCEDDNGAWFVLASDIELVEDETSKFKFKVGDKCRVVTDDSCEGHGYDRGDIVTVIEVDEDDPRDTYRCEDDDDDDNQWWCGEDDLELVENEKPELKVGDRCRVVGTTRGRGVPHHFKNGTIVTIVNVRGKHGMGPRPYYCEGETGTRWWCFPEELELVEDEKPEEKPEEKPDGGYSAVPGELVKIIDTHLHAFKMGEVVIVIKQREDTAYLCHNGVYDQIVFATDIAEIVVGDKIKVAE